MGESLRANTFSICAVNPNTGEAGVAVASRALAVGAHVPYAAPGVGAIATQAVVNPAYGTRGLELLAEGRSASDVVRTLTVQDVTVTTDTDELVSYYEQEQLTEEGVDYFRDPATGQRIWRTDRIRQVGIVDRAGRAAVHSGARIFPEVGEHVGDGYCCQGNMLASRAVVKEMAAAFEAARGSSPWLIEPLHAALRAGDAAGGDRRGKLAAAILVIGDRQHWSGDPHRVDLRVDHHKDPVAELGRILATYEFFRA